MNITETIFLKYNPNTTGVFYPTLYKKEREERYSQHISNHDKL